MEEEGREGAGGEASEEVECLGKEGVSGDREGGVSGYRDEGMEWRVRWEGEGCSQVEERFELPLGIFSFVLGVEGWGRAF